MNHFIITRKGNRYPSQFNPITRAILGHILFTPYGGKLISIQ